MRAMGTALQFVLLLLLSGSPALAQRTTVTMATATPGGGFMLFGDQAAKAMSAADPSLDVVTRSTKGSSENIKLLEARAIDLGLVAGLPAYEALAGIGRPKANLKILAAIYSSPGMFVVSGASPARSVRDLVGKPIAWGTRASGLTLMAKYVMDGLGLDRDKDFKPHFLEKAGDGPGMVKDGRVAAVHQREDAIRRVKHPIGDGHLAGEDERDRSREQANDEQCPADHLQHPANPHQGHDLRRRHLRRWKSKQFRGAMLHEDQRGNDAYNAQNARRPLRL